MSAPSLANLLGHAASSHFRKVVLAGCVALLLAAMAMPANAVMPAAWKTTNYALAPGEARVRDVLGDLQKTLGLGIEMTQAVQGSISSAGEATTVEGLLNKIAVNNGLNWFVFRNRLYVSRESEVEEAHLPAPADQVGELRSYLGGLRLLEDKFGWVEMPSRNEVSVIGPPAYIRLVRQHAASVKLVKPKEPTPAEPMRIMTFRLRHASAIDIPATGGTAMVPGIASLLRKLYGDEGLVESVVSGDRSILDASSIVSKRQRRHAQLAAARADSDAAAARRSAVEGAVDDDQQAAEPSIPAFPVRMRSPSSDPAVPSAPRTLSRDERFSRTAGDPDERPSFYADPRLNMILVRDRGSKRAEYERLIADLDVATLQFGLNAVVLELDTDALGVLLAEVARAPRPGPLASSVVVSRTAVEALYPALRAARQCKQDVSLISQSIVFKENDSFGINFADDLVYPTMSTPFWYSLLSRLVRLPQEQVGKARTIGLKLEGSARAVGDQRVALRFELADGRDNPLDRGEFVSKRLTETRMSIDLAEDDVLLLVDALAWSGSDMKASRSRMVMLSAHRWSREDSSRQFAAAAALAPSVDARMPACAASASAPAPRLAPQNRSGVPASTSSGSGGVTSSRAPLQAATDVYAR
ncbi:MAG: secretin N-terminal domain-containing protein [Janthinobacterium lividum]